MSIGTIPARDALDDKANRLFAGKVVRKDLVRKVLLYVIIGIGIGAFIHGFVPMELIAQIGGRDNPFAVPIVVAITALSVPEFVILRRVMKIRLMVAFAAVVVTGILAVGFLFNALGL